jgi:hypothetical protein
MEDSWLHHSSVTPDDSKSTGEGPGDAPRNMGVGVRGMMVVYELEMGVGSLPVSESILKFRFTEDDRKGLAKLRAGQRVTIEGKPEGHSSREEKGPEIIYFFECRIVRAEE